MITGPRGYSPLEAFQHPGHVVLESVAYLLALEPRLQHREKGLAVPFLERDGHHGVHTASPLAAVDRLPVDEAARIIDLGENDGFAIRLRARPPVNNGPRAAKAQIEIRFDDRAPLSSELGPSIEERVKDRLGWSIESLSTRSSYTTSSAKLRVGQIEVAFPGDSVVADLPRAADCGPVGAQSTREALMEVERREVSIVTR